MNYKYIASRVGQAVIVLLVLSFLVFSLLYLAPGDLAKTLIGTRKATPEAIAAINIKYQLDQPFLVRYWSWLSAALTGDFGNSIRSDVPVTSVLSERLSMTISLSVLGFFLAVGLGIPLGILAARHLNTPTDRAIVGWSVVGVSAPSFALGLVLLYVFSVMLGWFPVYGVGDGFWDQLWHLILPSIAVSAGITAIIVKITRTCVSRELGQDYVTFARSRGLSSRRISGLVAKNAAIPIVTSTGLILATLFGSTVLIETTFALPGIGQLLADSITFKDIPVVQAITILVAVIIVVSMLIVDLVSAYLNPALKPKKANRGIEESQVLMS